MRKFALTGYPIGHSKSPAYFNQRFANEGIDATYGLMEIAPREDLGKMFDADLDGFNVTSPYKQDIIPYLDSLSEGAAEIGAVNTVKREADGTHRGYNTDAAGFAATLPEITGKALVLGTGGAARAVAYALKSKRIEVSVVSRKLGDGVTLTYADLTDDVIRSHKLIVNATPVGMGALEGVAPAIPYEALTPEHLCYDLIYKPEQTEFLKLSAQNGANTMNGRAMLEAQAKAAFDIWFNP